MVFYNSNSLKVLFLLDFSNFGPVDDFFFFLTLSNQSLENSLDSFITSDYFLKLRTLSERLAQSFKPFTHPVEIMLIWISDNPFRNHIMGLQTKYLDIKFISQIRVTKSQSQRTIPKT